MANPLHPGNLYKKLHEKFDLPRNYLFKAIFPDKSNLVTFLTSSTGTPVETT